CERHRYLLHDDLLILGNRSFSAEIAACSSAFLRNPSVASVKTLFFRSLRKLQIRFSPVLMEDDPKMSKLSSAIQSLDEKLNELWSLKPENCDKESRDIKPLEKLCESLIKETFALENEGLSANIPISHIRSASTWCRLAPVGKHKVLIIENSENMREEARNSLLKLLEEPPASVSIVLTAKRREAIMPTILSRLRPYRFLKRDIEKEKEVIRLVFKDTVENINEKQKSLLSAYLESFAPQSTEKMETLAAWFIVSMARIIAISIKRTSSQKMPVILNMLGDRYSQMAETLKLERAVKSDVVIKNILIHSGNFENDSFSRFMKICLELICAVTRHAQDPQFIVYNDIFKKYIGEAVTAVEVLNIKETIALETLLYNLKKAIKAGQNG
ncbi:MAG: DNA polymerase III, partial [Treponema sp.]|nr:DNA polymerase III [Treponema sp.]